MLKTAILALLSASAAFGQFNSTNNTIQVTVGAAIPAKHLMVICSETREYLTASFTCTAGLASAGLCASGDVGTDVPFPITTCDAAAQGSGWCLAEDDGRMIPTPSGCAYFVRQRLRAVLLRERNNALTARQDRLTSGSLETELEEGLGN